MFDIVKVHADAKTHGFEKFYSSDSANSKIKICSNLADAAKYKNQKMLLTIRELDFDIGSLKLLAEKKKACLLFDLSKIIKSNGIRRSIEFAKLRTTLKFCNKYGVFYTFATFADEELAVRTIHELTAICMLLGINKGQVEFALSMLKNYL